MRYSSLLSDHADPSCSLELLAGLELEEPERKVACNQRDFPLTAQ